MPTTDLYQQIKNFSHTIISLQYNSNEFLTFRVSDVTQGQIVHSGTQGISLQCQIDKKTYIFSTEHFDQMSNREVIELLNHLGVESVTSYQ